MKNDFFEIASSVSLAVSISGNKMTEVAYHAGYSDGPSTPVANRRKHANRARFCLSLRCQWLTAKLRPDRWCLISRSRVAS